MTYTEATEYLFGAVPMYQRDGSSAYKPGLETIIALDEAFGHPHQAYATIHIGGTNGKGSTSHSLASILQAAGYRVGLFTSPHLTDFRERIRVNGEPISKEAVVRYTEAFIPWVDRLHPSFFELSTMMALAYFRERAVDYAIIEVGLGGRLDSTNIINPILSVITNISLDHTQFLGNTLGQIAGEKAGIIKSNIPVIIGRRGETEVSKVFEQKASESFAPLYWAEEQHQVVRTEGKQDGLVYYQTAYGELGLALRGDIQSENLQTILTAVDVLSSIGGRISNEAIRTGLSEVVKLTGLRGRWEQISTSPFVICDTAHNEDGVRQVSNQLLKMQVRALRIVLGMAKDKDIDSVLRLLPRQASYYFTQAKGDRALPAVELQEMASRSHLLGEAYSTVEEAYLSACRDYQEGDLIFIGGSNFVVADLLDYFHDNINN